VHGLLHAYGMVIPKGVAKCRQAVVGKLESEKDQLTPHRSPKFGGKSQIALSSGDE